MTSDTEVDDNQFKRRKEKRHLNKDSNDNAGVKKMFKTDWSQTDAEVTVVLHACQGIEACNVKLFSTDNDCEIKFNNGWQWKCKVYSKIVGEGTTKLHKGNRVIVKMVKKIPGEHWPQLELCDKEKEVEDIKEPYKELVELSDLHHNHYERLSNDTISVYVYVKNINKETIDIAFEEKSVTLKYQTSDNKFLGAHVNCSQNTVFMWKINLKHNILTRASTYKLSPVRLELTLKKSEYVKWGSLEKVIDTVGVALPQNKWVPAAVPESKDKEGDIDDANVEAEASSTLFTNATKSIPPKKPTCMVLPLNKSKTERVVTQGMTGLDNLGNTCFVNSVIQCLSNTREFRDYFLNAQFQGDINCDNPLGMGGKLALSFAVLLRVLWSATHHSYAPAKLKSLISMKASQFTGFAQHDAQEFMAFLLDGLHEDLNRVITKPYVENVESDDKDDNQLAEESWARYKMRNDSVVVDLFQGQYKSKLVCPVCDKVSITFDPFIYLSVPLPKKQLFISIIFFWRDTFKRPVKYYFNLPHESTVEDLKNRLNQKTGVESYNQIIMEVYKGKVHKLFGKDSLLSSINPHDVIFGFEKLDECLSGEPVVELAVIQRMLIPKRVNRCSFCRRECLPNSSERLKRCTKCYRVGYCDQICQKNHWSTHKANCKACPEVVGQPFIISIPESQATYSKLCSLMEAYSRHSVDIFQPPVSTNDASSRTSEISSTITSNQLDKCSSISNQYPCSNDSNQASASSLCQSLTASHASEELFNSPTGDQEVPESISAVSSSNNKDSSTESSNDSTSQLSESFSKSCKEMSSSTRLVCGMPENDNNTQSFFIKPVDKFALSSQMDRLSDQGETPLDLSSHYYLGMDWKNNPKTKNFILVQSKDVDFEEDRCDAGVKNFTLDDCLQLFTEPETLSPQEAWYCSRCKKHREATKEMSLWRLPTILIIQLKRFSFKNLIWRDKIDKMVGFPIRGLDVSPYYCGPTSNGSTIYDLYAVINHHGGILGGHYTAYGRCVDLNNTRRNEVDWRLFDDSRVSFTNENDVVTKAAYVLFYRRRGVAFNTKSVVPSAVVDRKLSSLMSIAKKVESQQQDSDDIDSDDDANVSRVPRRNEDVPSHELDSNIISEQKQVSYLNYTNMDAVD